MVRITMQNGKTIDLELDAQAAPITCENFLKLVNQKFYDGLTFHRIIPGFMIQGGCPLGNGTGGISMARAMDPNSAGSQFFIMHADAPHLDGDYAAFGHVVSGIEVVDEIANVPTDWNDKPTKPVVIESIRVVED